MLSESLGLPSIIPDWWTAACLGMGFALIIVDGPKVISYIKKKFKSNKQ